MNIKKILALTIIVLAVFSCLSVASAGLFDFLGGDQAKNKTITFDTFTLSLPDNAKVTNNNHTNFGITFNEYVVEYNNGKNDTFLLVEVAEGNGTNTSADEYKNYWLQQEGAKDGGKYGNWTIIDITTTPSKDRAGVNYLFVQNTNTSFDILMGGDLNEMKKVSDTFKQVKK